MKKEKIYLAGGCFWGTEHYMKNIPGVVSTQVGYALGKAEGAYAADPQYVTYRNVCAGNGYAETVEVEFDAEAITLREVLDEFAYTIDPTLENRQGLDFGVQYRTGIYYLEENKEHSDTVTRFLHDLQKSYDKKIMTENLPLLQFVSAEEYHQKYLVKNPGGYCHINFAEIARRKAQKVKSEE